MQLSRLYANQPEIFEAIEFNSGRDADRLNIVIGEVHRPRDRKRDSHNLGKTTLLHLIDFMMLKGLSPDHFLSKHQDRFQSFVFYLEIALNAGDFATIRRTMSAPTKISLRRHPARDQDFSEAPDDTWDHVDLPIEEAIRLLDAWLDLRVLKPIRLPKGHHVFPPGTGGLERRTSARKVSGRPRRLLETFCRASIRLRFPTCRAEIRA